MCLKMGAMRQEEIKLSESEREIFIAELIARGDLIPATSNEKPKLGDIKLPNGVTTADLLEWLRGDRV